MSPATYTKPSIQSKVHFSQYLRTENQPSDGDKPAETAQPEPKEAE